MTRINSSNSAKPEAKSKLLSARRLTLLASVAGLGFAMVIAAPSGDRALSRHPGRRRRTRPKPQWHHRGFADLVAKVKPAVISVRVKIEEAGQYQRHGPERGH